MAESITNTRLDRIESKLDALTERSISIARAEEQLKAIEAKYVDQYDRLNRFSEKLDNITLILQQNTSTVTLYNKVVGAATLAAVGAWAAQLFM